MSFLQNLTEVIPAADLLLGGIVLVVIMLIHAAGVRWITDAFARYSKRTLATREIWRADVLMSSMVLLLLSLHVIEIVVWATTLIYSGLVTDWRAAGFFAGNTYTTIGYGSDILPAGWKMLAPIIAISGLFTFGWSGSVLVNLIGRVQQIKDAASPS